LWLLALVYTLWVAREFLVPVTLAVLLALSLRPIVRGLGRLRIPEPVAAALIVAALGYIVVIGVYSLGAPAAEWLKRGPESLARAEQKLRALRQPVDRVAETARKVENMVTPQPAQEVQLRGDGLGAAVFGGTKALVTDTIVVTLMLYFFLASGNAFLRKLVRALPRFTDKRRAIEIAREVEAQISSYLLLTGAINVAFGAAVGLAMYVMGLPNTVLWGAIAGLLNFVPYLGGLVCAAIFGLVALLHFDDVGRALLVPGVFVALNVLEGNLVKPLLMSQRLTLNPVAVFLGVLFWGWIWGMVGAFLAVPILAVLRLACDRSDGLSTVSELLGP
jgi:predicted PurR-regulated permease PerM